MEIFENADVVVDQREVVAGFDKEGVTPPGVLEVVDERPENQCHDLDVLQMLPQVAHLPVA